MVKIEFGKKDFVWIGLLIVFAGVGFVYSFGGNEPSVMGHTLGEIQLNETRICNFVTGHACGYDESSPFNCGDDEFLRGDGECVVIAGTPTAGADCPVQRRSWGSGCDAFTRVSSDGSVIGITSAGPWDCGTATLQCDDGTWNFISGDCAACTDRPS